MWLWPVAKWPLLTRREIFVFPVGSFTRFIDMVRLLLDHVRVTTYIVKFFSTSRKERSAQNAAVVFRQFYPQRLYTPLPNCYNKTTRRGLCLCALPPVRRNDPKGRRRTACPTSWRRTMAIRWRCRRPCWPIWHRRTAIPCAPPYTFYRPKTPT